MQASTICDHPLSFQEFRKRNLLKDALILCLRNQRKTKHVACVSVNVGLLKEESTGEIKPVRSSVIPLRASASCNVNELKNLLLTKSLDIVRNSSVKELVTTVGSVSKPLHPWNHGAFYFKGI